MSRSLIINIISDSSKRSIIKQGIFNQKKIKGVFWKTNGGRMKDIR